MTWTTSSRCGGGACVEVLASATAVHVRDATGVVMSTTRAHWRDFIGGVKAGMFDGR